MVVKNGDTVSVHYIGKFEDGQEFDSSKGSRAPLIFEVGGGQVIPGFEEAAIGMKEGEKKEISIPPERGYGELREDLIKECPRSMLGTSQASVGQVIQLKTREGQIVSAMVEEITDNTVTFNFNHPLAGKTLCFEIELASIQR